MFPRALVLLLFLGVAFGRTLHVCPSCALKTLKAAFAAAKDGDTLVIEGGPYREGPLKLDKRLTLVGKNFPVIDGEGKYEILLVTADGVQIRGIEFRGAGVNFVEDQAAVKMKEVKNCVIENNRFINNFFAIYLEKSAHCMVRNNEIVSNAENELYSGNGIHLWNSYDVDIVGNHVAHHRDGIYLEFVRNSRIVDNVSEDNVRYGLHFMFSENNVFTHNVFRRSGAGVAVMYSKKTRMENNRFEYNWGGASYGLLLKDIDDSDIRRNTFFRNSVGIYADGSNRTTVWGNDFIQNGYGMRVFANSMGMLFMYNNFIGNTFDVTTNSTKSYNSYLKNYWDKYEGYDLNKDGIGDVPYRPVRLFALVVEDYPQALVLLHSPLVQLLDRAEKIFPVFTPKAIEDDQPLMFKIQWSELKPLPNDSAP